MNVQQAKIDQQSQQGRKAARRTNPSMAEPWSQNGHKTSARTADSFIPSTRQKEYKKKKKRSK
jgi:hypothetical protein